MTNEKHDPIFTEQEELKFCQKELDTSIGQFKQDVYHTSYQEQQLSTKKRHNSTRRTGTGTLSARKSGNHPLYEEQETPMKRDFKNMKERTSNFIHDSSTHQ